MNKILFYKTREKYGCFSNFAKYPIMMDGWTYLTSEHYYQSKKFEGTEFERIVRMANTAKEAAAIGRDRSLPLRRDWEEVKDDIMRDVVLAKFSQYISLKKILLSTGDAILCEHTENDDYWADGKDGKGKNMLGVILMEIRRMLRYNNYIRELLKLQSKNQN